MQSETSTHRFLQLLVLLLGLLFALVGLSNEATARQQGGNRVQASAPHLAENANEADRAFLPVLIYPYFSDLFPYLVKDIYPGYQYSMPIYKTGSGDQIVFRANDGIHGVELWRSDGTSAGTVMVKDINPVGDSHPYSLTRAGDYLYFFANDESHGYELWRSDGTETGTVLVKDINPGGNGAISASPYIVNVDGILYFVADDGLSGDVWWELWKSDGTPAGTVLVTNNIPGSEGTPPFLGTGMGGILYFMSYSDNPFDYYELMRSDGTAAGTYRVKDINPGGGSSPQWLTAVGNVLYFNAASSGGRELWRSDGTEQGTFRVKDINPAGSSDPSWLREVNDTLFFVADDGVAGEELWLSDGTEAGTALVRDINPGDSSSPFELTAVGDKLFFWADDGLDGMEPWLSDGTAAGTSLIKDIKPGSGDSKPVDLFGQFTDVNGVLFFHADDGVHGVELWRSDGTAAGTYLVSDINPGGASGIFDWSSMDMESVGTLLYFAGLTEEYGVELWAVDTTSPGSISNVCGARSEPTSNTGLTCN